MFFVQSLTASMTAPCSNACIVGALGLGISYRATPWRENMASGGSAKQPSDIVNCMPTGILKSALKQ